MTTKPTSKTIAIRLTPRPLPLPKMMVEEGERSVVSLTETQAALYPSLSPEQWETLRAGGTTDIYELSPDEQIVLSPAGAIGVTKDRLPPIEQASPHDSLTVDFLGGPGV